MTRIHEATVSNFNCVLYFNGFNWVSAFLQAVAGQNLKKAGTGSSKTHLYSFMVIITTLHKLVLVRNTANWNDRIRKVRFVVHHLLV